MENQATDVSARPRAEGPVPPEWLIWASAIEHREHLRYRLSRASDTGRLSEAVAQHSAEGGMLDWTQETLEFVENLRAGADRPELHPQPEPRRWSISRPQEPKGDTKS